jgi:ATP-binding cassette subfamily B protein
LAPAALADMDQSFLFIGIPIALTLLYGFSRVLMALLTQVRDALFAAVAMHSVRRLANETFEHMHRLSLRFHLERKTGGLTRVLDRGRAGIESIVRMTMLTLAPTIVEFVMILAVLLYEFDWRYALVTILMIFGYMLFTTKATEWRMNIRRSMNDSDTDASGKAVDSLLNFETVKYFGAEPREAARYDKAMEKFERASVKAYVSLAVLNSGQAIIFTLGLTVCMALFLQGIRDCRHTVGDFVLVNAMLIQLYQPLNFMGMVYR